MKNSIEKISIIGSGNVAWHLSTNFVKIGIKVTHIFGRNTIDVHSLCKKVNAIHSKSIKDLPKNQLVIICTPDDAITNICKSIDSSCPIAYTSGSVEIQSLPYREKIGVIYPLQTFSKNIKIKLNKVPFFIESTNNLLQKQLYNLTLKISNNVKIIDSIQRKKIHLAAVFVNNFTNHIIYQAQNYAKTNSINFKDLMPLLEETFNKINIESAFKSQTGPARRGDNNIIKQHIEILKGNSKEIYMLLSKSIKDTYNEKL